ncbi:MAG: hypothetical protein KF760_02240 [Candidatus Eremiobacteraeota bacterium]|nr:hypothetical protein [Candidatus Eremiobacteraeota bacterium]
MWRGAKMGAVSLGLVGFVGGITVCVAYHLPFPPIAVSELGILLGGCLGAMAGYAWCYPTGRNILRGAFWGALFGLAPAGLPQGNVSVPVWLACVMLAAVIGYQAGCSPQNPQESGWRLR